MKSKKLLKRILKRFLTKTFCIHLNGNKFREGEVLSAGKNKAGMLIVRKDIQLTSHYVFTKLYCVLNKKYKYKWVNKLRKRIYTWLAYNDLFC